jgi:hypothetical protein
LHENELHGLVSLASRYHKLFAHKHRSNQKKVPLIYCEIKKDQRIRKQIKTGRKVSNDGTTAVARAEVVAEAVDVVVVCDNGGGGCD